MKKKRSDRIRTVEEVLKKLDLRTNRIDLPDYKPPTLKRFSKKGVIEASV